MRCCPAAPPPSVPVQAAKQLREVLAAAPSSKAKPRAAAKVGARDVAGALARQGVSELTPEAGFAAAVRAAAPANGRSWIDYFTKPETAEATPDHLSESAARKMLGPDQMSVPDVRSGHKAAAPAKSAIYAPLSPRR